jgi:hypothetical protein
MFLLGVEHWKILLLSGVKFTLRKPSLEDCRVKLRGAAIGSWLCSHRTHRNFYLFVGFIPPSSRIAAVSCASYLTVTSTAVDSPPLRSVTIFVSSR